MNNKEKTPFLESKFMQFIKKFPEVVAGPVMMMVVFILIIIATKGLGLIPEGDAGTVAIKIGTFEIRWYAIFILTGLIFAAIFGYYEFPRIGVSRNDLTDGLLVIAPLAILGTRFYYVIFDPDKSKYKSFGDVLNFTQGGLAIHGAIIVAIIGVIIFAKLKKKGVWQMFDILVIGLLIGQIIGRWGNFMNREAHGPVVGNSWVFQYFVPGFIKKNMVIAGETYHPTFLYEGTLNFIVLVALLVIRRFRLLKVGDNLGLYLIAYGIIRGAIIEPLRTDPLYIGSLRVNIVFSLVLFVGGGALYLILKYIFAKNLPYYYDLAIDENLYDKGLEGRDFRKRKKEELKKIREKSKNNSNIELSNEQIAQEATKKALEEQTKGHGKWSKQYYLILMVH